MTGDWADKGDESPLITPVHERLWVRVLISSIICVVGLAGVGAIAWFNHWHDARLAELARQRHCLQAFLHSPEFAQFVRAMDEQTVATLNYISARPAETHALLPALAERDKARRAIPWTQQVLPLPIATASEPVKVAAATRRVHALLVERGYVFDEAARKSARQLFLRTLVPFAQRFIQREPSNVFHAVFLDRTMQEEALAVFARHHGAQATVADTERFFSLYAVVGPALWKAIESERAKQSTFVVPAR